MPDILRIKIREATLILGKRLVLKWKLFAILRELISKPVFGRLVRATSGEAEKSHTKLVHMLNHETVELQCLPVYVKYLFGDS